MNNTPIFTKPHYELLDALRGVAALIVICYHIGEGFATSSVDLVVNHGYLAVDFFFMLSGFVISYAYDDRWKKGLKIGDFFKRRFIRLHPMVAMGVLFGVISYCLQGCVKWSGESVPFSMVFISAFMALFMLPALPGTSVEVRGNNEMFPINGPEWSLFFEYIAYALYAIFMHRISTRILKLLTFIFGVSLLSIALFSGTESMGMGWTLLGLNFPAGLCRVGFAFSMGMLLRRTFRPNRVPYAFAICAIVLIVLLSIPYVGTVTMPWINCLYEVVCIAIVFPAVIYIGACGCCENKIENRICDFLGQLSYPLYIIHYPFMYLFYWYVWSHGYGFTEVIPQAIAAVGGSILTALLLMHYYDIPTRRWLSNKLK